MIDIVSEIFPVLICPDDGSNLLLENNKLICTDCKRNFIIDKNIIDLRPKENLNIDDLNVVKIYKTYYKNLVTYGSGGEKIGTFGISSNSISRGFVKDVLSLIGKHISRNMFICDIGAGSGDYSVELSKKCKFMLHCDLDLNGIKIAQETAKKHKIDNIVFLYCNYFKLPLKNKMIDLIYSIDILERGIKHEKKILQEIERISKSHCKILVDFHSKERKRLTHSENESLCTYSKNEIKDLISGFQFEINSITGTGFIPQLIKYSNTQYKILNPLARLLSFPPARWLVLFFKN